MASSSTSSSQDELSEMDKPVKFSTSEANKHRSYDSFFRKTNAPWYQRHFVAGSISVFLLYFCVFREENDIDEQMGQTLWMRIPALRYQTLIREIKKGKDAGTDVSELEKELEELEKSK